MNPFQVGDWVRWTTPDSVKEGEVMVASGPSIELEWLGGGRQVFPIVEGYIAGPYRSSSSSMVVIPRPREAARIKRDEHRGHMSVARASALLGIERKRIRAMLRAGTLRGRQVGGRWVDVNSDDVMRKVEHGAS